ncbi:MAG: SpoIID/LytB domain-containing protein [Acidobacteria bacterium ACB2]|nr:SpoIID/LytB domain-containing protein [Acidobacteria bacterium ACB2]
MNVSVGLVEGLPSVEVELSGAYLDARGRTVGPGRLALDGETTLVPREASSSSFALDVTIGIGFHWERRERQAFRGALRVLRRGAGLTVVNDVPLEEYVTSVVSSEMSASCPLELLKAHAVISRSWLKGPSGRAHAGAVAPAGTAPGEVRRWYGREAHPDFEVCADDHCQRYQGITKAFSPAAAEAVRATAGEMLLFEGSVCDARFSKCCGGLTEEFATAWEDEEVPYLASVPDGLAGRPADLEAFIRSSPEASCNTRDAGLLARILPGFDQETTDFFRWRLELDPGELGETVLAKLGTDLGRILDLEPLARGPSGRIHRLRIRGERGELVVGKELEVRRALSPTHLKSSAFVVDRKAGRFVLTGAGWGHGVGLCQIGAAVRAARGHGYREILDHYYPGTTVGVPRPLPDSPPSP